MFSKDVWLNLLHQTRLYYSLMRCDVLLFTVILASHYATVSLRPALITEFVTTLHGWGGNFSLEIATYPLPFASNKTFAEPNCHLGLHPCVWPRLERPESKRAEKLVQNLNSYVQRRWRTFCFLSLFTDHIRKHVKDHVHSVKTK